jgi:hypothetical protein
LQSTRARRQPAIYLDYRSLRALHMGDVHREGVHGNRLWIPVFAPSG